MPKSGALGSGAIGGIWGALIGCGAGVPGAAAGGGAGVVVVGIFIGSHNAGPGARKLQGGHSHWHSAGGGGSCCNKAMHNRARPLNFPRTLSSVAFVALGGGGGGGGGVGLKRHGSGGATGPGESVGR